MHNHYNNDGKNNLKDIHLALILNFLSKKGDVTECMDEGDITECMDEGET